MVAIQGKLCKVGGWMKLHVMAMTFSLSEKLARMAGMTAPLPDTASRKAKSWEQVVLFFHG